jgi:prepilin-type processing-associated H-X9-DG protein
MRRLAISAVVATVFSLPLGAQSLPPDLDSVPDGALGFVHVRVAEIWKGDAFKDMRAIIEKAGPAYFKLLDEHFVPAPSTIDRLTLILTIDPKNSEPTALFVLTTKSPFDREKLLKKSLTKAVERRAGDATYYFDEELKIAVQAPTDTMVVFGPDKAMKAYLSGKKTNRKVFGPALREAAGGKEFAGAVNLAALPNDGALNEFPPQIQPLLKGCLIQISADLGSKSGVDIQFQYADAGAADRAEKAAKDAFDFVRHQTADLRKNAEEGLFNKKSESRSPLLDIPQATGSLAMLGMINRAESMLAQIPIKRAGNSLTARIDIPEQDLKTVMATSGIGVGLLLPAVQKVREAAARTKDANNLKQIAIAMLNYESAVGRMPPAAICDKNGKPLLSWRVAILPYIEQQNLYQQFHLDEPWDSEHNIKLARIMPSVYFRPIDPISAEIPTTCYLALVGNGAGFELNRGLSLLDFTDGTSNTLLVVESEKAVPWTKPEDIEYDPKKMPPIAFSWSGRTQVLFADGSVRALSKRVPEKTWHLLIQRADGQPIPPGDLDK